MAIKVRQLKDQIGVPGPHPFLYCRECGGEYSANAGDYFMRRPGNVLTCCEVPLELCVKKTVYRKVKV